MRNRKVKIFALVLAGCLSLSGLTGCGGGIKMTTDDTSSKSDSGLMGSAKKEAEKSDESEADSADEEDKISDDMIGRYVSRDMKILPLDLQFPSQILIRWKIETMSH